jgi:hypothetical protein
MRLGVTLLALTLAFGSLRDSVLARSSPAGPVNYVYEIWYDIERGMGPQFDLYLSRLKEVTREVPDSPTRWVDSHPATNKRLVSLPASRLADYRSERYNESGLRKSLGDKAYEELAKIYSDAQISRRSYIRQCRTDLSLNPHHYSREHVWATEYTLVTVEPGKEKQFERLWLTAIGAYAKVAHDTILIGTVTLVGGGPQFIVRHPLGMAADVGRLPDPPQAVLSAFGSSEAQVFTKAWTDTVNKWETLVLERTDLDTGHTTSVSHEGK